ncbi:MAG TPA: arsenate reductase (glutaredoxin) [Bacteriovoracaceae bacterium]|nr:arsenate reductase (glutaredoxin) [Bacteriovoracaceae bacterium]
MKKYTIYHNPRCSKSREALKILENAGVDFEVVEYLKTPPKKADLQGILKKLNDSARNIVRTKESVFAELEVDLDNENQIIDAILKHPILLERPIVVTNNRAVIGRPPENILDLL